MFNIFKSVAVSKAKSTQSIQDINKAIEEIHESFYTEVDKLLYYAKIKGSLDTDKNDLIKKRDRLIAMGFKNTKEVKEAQAELNRLNKIKEENQSKNSIAEAIEYFSQKYPMYKFITEESVRRICDKYNLVYGKVSKYIGTVPDTNLAHIENFKINKEDECYYIADKFVGFRLQDEERYISFLDYSEKLERRKTMTDMEKYSNRLPILNKCSLEIAAPVTDFDITGSEIKDFKISNIPDPIVLKPVFFNNEKHYLIVTAWGQEASDSEVINPKNN